MGVSGDVAQRKRSLFWIWFAIHTQLIARRIREQHVYAEILPWNAPEAQIVACQPAGIVLSGGPNSVYDAGAPGLPDHVVRLGTPVLGICYGMHLLAHALGGKVNPGAVREYGPADVDIMEAGVLFADLAPRQAVWMSHGDCVAALPPGFRVLARSADDIVAAMSDAEGRIYGVQFHPEVQHTPNGAAMLRHFLYDVCGCAGTWTPGAFIEDAVGRIRAQVGGGQVICGLSGGVDSAVVAALIHKAVDDQLTCIFVDTGLLRRDRSRSGQGHVQEALRMRLVMVDLPIVFWAR